MWALASRAGSALHFLAVFVRSRGEDRLVTLHALEEADRIGGNGGIGVADVGRSIHIVDRGCQVVFHL